MRREAMVVALATAFFGLAGPAWATKPPPHGTYLGGSTFNDPCHDVFVTGAIACQGYYEGNLLQGAAGDATPSDIQSILNLLLTGTPTQGDGSPTDNGPAYTGSYPGLNYSNVLATLENQNGNDGHPFNFVFGGPALSGLTIFGAHFGNNTDSSMQDVTAFWLVDLGTGSTHTITVSDGAGVSNAQIFATGNFMSVPEPRSWGLMLLGFGGIGLALRRSRKRKPLMQVA